MDANEKQMNFLRPRDFERPERFRRKILIISLILILFSAGSAFTIAAKSGGWEETTLSIATLQPKKLGFLQIVKNFIFPPDAPLMGEGNDRVNILLLGMGGPGHDGPYLTDTNIIVSIRPRTREVAMISIPRDLMVKINGYGYHRINYANSYGESINAGQGGDFARKIFSETFDIDIPYYVRVDFAAFKEIIDAIGGVTIKIERSFTDYSYPGPNKSYQTVSFQAGTEEMNGDRALIFARSRHGTNGESSDFARAKRQQQVLSALKEKTLSAGTYLNPVKISKIMDSLNRNIATNLELNQIMNLARVIKDADSSFKNLVIDAGESGFLTTARSPEGAYLLAPRTGNFNQINAVIENVFNASMSSTAATQEQTAFPRARIELQNGTWRVGLAMKAKERLERQGFFIASVGNSIKRPVSTSAIYIVTTSISNDLLEALKKELGAPISLEMPEWLKTKYDDPLTTSSEAGLKYKEGTEVLIVLGEDITE